MNFAEGVDKAYKIKWAYVNTFQVQFLFSELMKENVGWTPDDEDGLNINIKGISTPQYTNQPIEVYVGDQWKIHNGRNELWKFTISFRDQDQLTLYRKFVKSYNWQKTAYFDQCKMDITLWKDADYQDEGDEILFVFNNVMIESVGQVQFSNETEAQIAEFDVEFKCTTPLIT
jgi:hypothetical protein